MPSKRRAAPEPVDPVTHNGVTYEVIHFCKPRGLKQNGGYVAKIDAESGDELGMIRIYKVRYSWWKPIERDKQDVFITDMTLDGNRLLISDERGGQFRGTPSVVAADFSDGEVQLAQSVLEGPDGHALLLQRPGFGDSERPHRRDHDHGSPGLGGGGTRRHPPGQSSVRANSSTT